MCSLLSDIATGKFSSHQPGESRTDLLEDTKTDFQSDKKCSTETQVDLTLESDSERVLEHTFECTCGKCSMEKYLSESDRYLKIGDRNFPYLDIGHLDSSSRVIIENKLTSDIQEIGQHFSDLVRSTRSSLEEQQVSPKILASSLLSIPAEEHSQATTRKPLLKQYEDELQNAECIASVFLVLSPFISFFNYEILDHITNEFGSQRDIKKLQNYLKILDQFCKRSVFEVPPDACGNVPDNLVPHVQNLDRRKLFVLNIKVSDCDDAFYSLKEVKNAQFNIAKQVGLKGSCLYLSRVDKGNDGCIEVAFLIPEFVAEELFPFKPSYVDALLDIGINIIVPSTTHHQVLLSIYNYIYYSLDSWF